MRDQDLFVEDAHDRPTALDRAWAATRPAELSDQDFDAIWSEVQRVCDQPRTLAFTPRLGSIRGLRVIGAGLASAAALFAGFVLTRPQVAPAPTVVASVPSPTIVALTTLTKVGDLKIDVDEMVVVDMAGSHVDTRRTKSDPGTTVAFLDVPADNPNDLLNHWEALAND